MDKLSREKKDSVIMGNFNINLLYYNNNKDTTTFLDRIFSNSFLPFITMPTRVANTSETLIDNIFYKKPLNNDMTGNLCSVISEHLGPTIHSGSQVFTLGISLYWAILILLENYYLNIHTFTEFMYTTAITKFYILS